MTKKELGKRFPNKVYFWNYIDLKIGWFYAPLESEWTQCDDDCDCSFYCKEVHYGNDAGIYACNLWGRSCYTSPEMLITAIFGTYVRDSIDAENALERAKADLAKVRGIMLDLINNRNPATYEKNGVNHA